MKKKHRYELLIEALGIDNLNRFATEIGVPRGTIGAAVERGSGISKSVIEKIVARFPQVNEDWLLTGKGKILLPHAHTIADGEPEYKPNMVKRIRTRWNEMLAKLAMDADGEELKQTMREMDAAIKELEEQTGKQQDE